MRGRFDASRRGGGRPPPPADVIIFDRAIYEFGGRRSSVQDALPWRPIATCVQIHVMDPLLSIPLEQHIHRRHRCKMLFRRS